MLKVNELLTPADVAHQLHVTPTAVRLWARLGKINVALQTSTGMRFYTKTEVARVATARAAIAAAKRNQ